MYPPVWGHYVWATIHLFAYNYPSDPDLQQKKSMISFLNGLADNLPCPQCRHHALQYFKDYPPVVTSNNELVHWCHDFHNFVNSITGTREMTFDEAEEAFKNRHFRRQDWIDLKRAQDMRREDHNTIDRMKSLLDNATIGKNTQETMVIVSLLIVLSIGIFVLILRKKRV